MRPVTEMYGEKSLMYQNSHAGRSIYSTSYGHTTMEPSRGIPVQCSMYLKDVAVRPGGGPAGSDK